MNVVTVYLTFLCHTRTVTFYLFTLLFSFADLCFCLMCNSRLTGCAITRLKNQLRYRGRLPLCYHKLTDMRSAATAMEQNSQCLTCTYSMFMSCEQNSTPQLPSFAMSGVDGKSRNPLRSTRLVFFRHHSTLRLASGAAESLVIAASFHRVSAQTSRSRHTGEISR